MKRKILETHTRIQTLQEEIGVVYDGEEWGKNCNFGFVNIAYHWAKGVSFLDILANTDIQEGIIVRTLVRLDEMLRKLKTVAQAMKHEPFEDLVTEAICMVKRDIVFMPSLYFD